MGSTDYLNSAKRAGIAFFVLASLALGAASYRLAITVWGAAPVALGPGEKLQSDPHRRAHAACGERLAPSCANVQIALGAVSLAR